MRLRPSRGSDDFRWAWPACLSVLASLSPAAAQDAPAADTWVIFRDEGAPPKPDWEFQLEPLLWYASAAGRLRFAGSSDSVEVRNLNLDSPRVSIGGEAHLYVGAWRLTLGGFDFGADDRKAVMEQAETIGGLTILPGDRAVSSLRVASAQVTGAYPLVFARRPARTPQGVGVTGTLEGVIGARFYSVDSDVRIDSADGGSESLSGDAFFAEPLAGIKGELLVSRWLSLDVETTFGGLSGVSDGSTFSWDIAVGVQARLLPNVGLQLGYRQLVMELDEDREDGFEFSGSLAGVYAGLTIRF